MLNTFDPKFTDYIGIDDNKLSIGPFDYSINLDDFLNTIFSDMLNQNQIQIIDFSDDFNHTLPKLSSLTLREIHFGKDYNQLVDNLPDFIEIIKFGSQFNQPVNNLPSNLKELTLGINFCHDLSNLPSGLKQLTIHNTCITDLSSLPESLEYLNVGNNNTPIHLSQNVNYELFSNLPNGLQILIIDNAFQFNLNNLPNSIEHLTLYGPSLNNFPNKIPSNIKNLTITYYKPMIKDLIFDLSNTNITMLVLEPHSNLKNTPIDKITKITISYPKNLEILHFCPDHFEFIKQMPKSLKYIFFKSKIFNEQQIKDRYRLNKTVYIQCNC